MMMIFNSRFDGSDICGLLMILNFKFAVNSGNAHRIDELNLLGVKTVNKVT